ncbi:Uncharacterized protein Adt_04378 [Abeliophyllum distichum]|uniref:Uncharacterized protein n=1 Tax=Abeliophyllum distichum TaxID=126358 RepID=A0ABD1W1M0_9LAMI
MSGDLLPIVGRIRITHWVIHQLMWRMENKIKWVSPFFSKIRFLPLHKNPSSLSPNPQSPEKASSSEICFPKFQVRKAFQQFVSPNSPAPPSARRNPTPRRKKGPRQKNGKAHDRSNGAFCLKYQAVGIPFSRREHFCSKKLHFGPAPREHFCSKKFSL